MEFPTARLTAAAHFVPGGMTACTTVVDGRTLLVQLLVKDRPGFLVALLERITAVDPDVNVDGGHAALAEAWSSVLLILRSVRKGHHLLDNLASALRDFGKEAPGGELQPPAALLRLRISAPDRPGSLLAICRRLDEMGINILEFRIEPYAGMELRGEQEEDAPPRLYNLRFNLAVPQEEMDAAMVQEAMADLGVTVIPA